MSPATMAALFGVSLLAIIVGFLVLSTYNAVIALRLRIDKAWANIDVALKQRFDQLPNLVEAVRGVMTWEQDVLTDVARARAAYSPTAPIPEQAATSVATSAAVRSLFAVVERYPEVRSAGNVMALQEEIERLEGIIADRRELYNDQVYRYNARIAQLPAVFLASMFGWRARPFFEASDAERLRPSAALDRGA
ncbi:MAG TPA: LemA family protein [Candidatus Limnocylindrales bacterium]|nr:LemA family protein [Candidatus Limnocylindrales bacterium]